jgi:hypothetical protein
LNPVFVLAIGGLSVLGTRGTKRLQTQATQTMPPVRPLVSLAPTSPSGPLAGGNEGFPVIPGLQMPPTLGVANAAGGPAQHQASMRASVSRTPSVRSIAPGEARYPKQGARNKFEL